ncbi:hypothetical protein F8M41_020571 [Gigaspora margarita]|uniref:Uncharacterized protein n=1 Tax=Gigaspora margarita TaxID=4874 RepID=A0A8H4B1V0_GIGMA|nr:hypothetical protein F8M41_020571 [Gigaspora margarita]
MENLYRNTTITTLGLFGSYERKVFIEIHNTLTSLSLNNGQLGFDWGKALAKSLCVNTILTFLNLTNNQLGGKVLAKIQLTNTSLSSLDLNDNEIGPEGGNVLAISLYKIIL